MPADRCDVFTASLSGSSVGSGYYQSRVSHDESREMTAECLQALAETGIGANAPQR